MKYLKLFEALTVDELKSEIDSYLHDIRDSGVFRIEIKFGALNNIEIQGFGNSDQPFEISPMLQEVADRVEDLGYKFYNKSLHIINDDIRFELWFRPTTRQEIRIDQKVTPLEFAHFVIKNFNLSADSVQRTGTKDVDMSDMPGYPKYVLSLYKSPKRDEAYTTLNINIFESNRYKSIAHQRYAKSMDDFFRFDLDSQAWDMLPADFIIKYKAITEYPRNGEREYPLNQKGINAIQSMMDLLEEYKFT